MTTNGVLLEEYLDDLCHAGLDAVNISWIHSAQKFMNP